MLNYSQEFGDVIRNRRIELGLTQNQVADQIDVDARTVLNIENHKGNPKMEVLFPLIRALKVDANLIFYPERRENKNKLIQMESLIAGCTEQELQALISVCETVLGVWRSREGLTIQDE